MKFLTYNIALVIIVAILAIGCKKDNPQDQTEFTLEEPSYFTEEEYEIYSILMNETYSYELIVIEQLLSNGMQLNIDDYYAELLFEHNPGFDTTLINNYNALSSTDYYFGDEFSTNEKETVLISFSEIQSIFNGQDVDSGWDRFYDKYPNSSGFVRFTRIAFNDNFTQAIFEVGHQFAGLGGSGSIIYFEMENGNWIMKDVIPTWIS